MGFDNLISSSCEDGELEGTGGQKKISVSDDLVNGVQHSDSFVVDMERFSHVIEKDINASSRITRNVSRKGSARAGGEKNISPTTANQRNASMLATSATASLNEGGMPEKPVVTLLAATDHSVSSKLHHQITIKNGGLSSPAAAKSQPGGRSLGFRHSLPIWSVDPRRILMFFATLSSLGTILLIYFTLSMGKLNGYDDSPN